MKIIHRNAAMLLFEKVHFLGQQRHDSWRCIHLGLSMRRERYNNMLRAYFIAKAIMELLSDTDGFVYLCSDGDVFILFQGSHKPIFAKLAAHFNEIASDAPQEEGLFTLFDLGRDWNRFYTLCKYKSDDAPPVWKELAVPMAYSALENAQF